MLNVCFGYFLYMTLKEFWIAPRTLWIAPDLIMNCVKCLVFKVLPPPTTVVVRKCFSSSLSGWIFPIIFIITHARYWSELQWISHVFFFLKQRVFALDRMLCTSQIYLVLMFNRSLSSGLHCRRSCYIHRCASWVSLFRGF